MIEQFPTPDPDNETRIVYFAGHKVIVPKEMTDSEVIDQLFKNGEEK